MVSHARERRHALAEQQFLKTKRSRHRSTQYRTPVIDAPEVRAQALHPDPQSLWGCGNAQGIVAVNVLKEFTADKGSTSMVKLSNAIENDSDHARLGGVQVGDDKTSYDTKAVHTWKTKHMHCRHFHPGMCKTVDAAVFSDAHAMFLKLQFFIGPLTTGL